jgi:hypothetical protein
MYIYVDIYVSICMFKTCMYVSDLYVIYGSLHTMLRVCACVCVCVCTLALHGCAVSHVVGACVCAPRALFVSVVLVMGAMRSGASLIVFWIKQGVTYNGRSCWKDAVSEKEEVELHSLQLSELQLLPVARVECRVVGVVQCSAVSCSVV